MKIHRFIDESFDLGGKDIIIENFEIVHQVGHVLRMKKGEHILLCNGQGSEAEVVLTTLAKTQLTGTLVGTKKSIPEPPLQVTLYASIIKGEHFEMIAEKAVEVGVARIVPLITSRTIKLNIKTDRIQKIMKEAAEQSGRGIVPLLEEPLTFAQALNESKINDKNFFCDFSPTAFSPSLITNIKSVGCFIGPEGGWDDAERMKAEQQGLVFISLGNFVFRAETAALVAAYLFCQH